MIKVAIAGVGNCASVPVQALSHAQKHPPEGFIREGVDATQPERGLRAGQKQ